MQAALIYVVFCSKTYKRMNDDANRDFLLILSLFNFYSPGKAQGKVLRCVEFKRDMKNIHM